jgi:hypothetical protein
MSAKDFVPAGAPVQDSGGETFAPSQVYLAGIAAPSAKAVLVSVKEADGGGAGGGGGDVGRFTKVAVTNLGAVIDTVRVEPLPVTPLHNDSFPFAFGTAVSLTRVPAAYEVRQV